MLFCNNSDLLTYVNVNMISRTNFVKANFSRIATETRIFS